MIKRWFEPVLCLLVVIGAFICYHYSHIELYIAPFVPDPYSSIEDLVWEMDLITLQQFPFALYQASFLWIIVFAVVGSLLLMRYRKIGVPILLIGGILQLLLSPAFYNYSNPSSYLISSLPSSLFALALMPIVLAFCLVIIAIIALIRKPLSKEKVAEIKKKLE